jgi:hypothetical protein
MAGLIIQRSYTPVKLVEGGRNASESVDGLDRNRWTESIGMGGRFTSESVDGMLRNTHNQISYPYQ